MKPILGVLTAVAVMTICGPAAADGFGSPLFGQGWYLELKAGAPIPPKTEIDVTGFGEGIYDEDSGFAGAVTVGMHYNQNWRGEIEFSYTNAEDGDVNFGAAKFPHKGDVDIYGFMANALYQFEDGWLKPFVGAGLGFSIIDVDDLGAVGGAFTVDDSDTVFVANLIAGVDCPVSEAVTLTARYTGGFSTKGDFDTTAAGIEVEKEAQFHNYLSFGVRIDLN